MDAWDLVQCLVHREHFIHNGLLSLLLHYLEQNTLEGNPIVYKSHIT